MADPNALRKVPTFNPRAATPRAMAQSEPPMLTVKAVVDQLTDKDGQQYDSPRVVYDVSDNPIPHDDFVTTPLTASLVLAIKAGDLTEYEPTPGLEPGSMPAEYGGRPSEEQAQAKIERAQRAEQARDERLGGERQEPQGADRQPQSDLRASQDRGPERRQEDQQSRG